MVAFSPWLSALAVIAGYAVLCRLGYTPVRTSRSGWPKSDEDTPGPPIGYTSLEARRLGGVCAQIGDANWASQKGCRSPSIRPCGFVQFGHRRIGGAKHAAESLHISRNVIYRWYEEGLSAMSLRTAVELARLANIPLLALTRRLEPYAPADSSGAARKPNK